MSLFDWQSDGHQIVACEVDRQLVLDIRCPAMTGRGARLCKVSRTYGGILPPHLDRFGICGVDASMSEPVVDYIDADCGFFAVDLGVPLEISWRVNSDGDGLIWAPRRWVEEQRQVAA